jgi:hypothetical protein
MDPKPQELATFDSILAVFKWLEMPDDVVAALSEAMGANNALRTWACIPMDRFTATIEGLKIGEGLRDLTPAEEGQAGEVPRLARLAVTAQAPVPLRPQEVKPAVSAVGTTQDGSPGVAPPGFGAAKIKLATVLDQGDDSEIKPLSVEKLRRMLGDTPSYRET